MSTAEVLKTIRTMTVQERMGLVEQICDSIEDNDISYELSEAEWKEVKRRLKDIEAHPEKGYAWEEVEAEIRARRNSSKSSSKPSRKKKLKRPTIILRSNNKG